MHGRAACGDAGRTLLLVRRRDRVSRRGSVLDRDQSQSQSVQRAPQPSTQMIESCRAMVDVALRLELCRAQSTEPATAASAPLSPTSVRRPSFALRPTFSLAGSKRPSTTPLRFRPPRTMQASISLSGRALASTAPTVRHLAACAQLASRRSYASAPAEEVSPAYHDRACCESRGAEVSTPP